MSNTLGLNFIVQGSAYESWLTRRTPGSDNVVFVIITGIDPSTPFIVLA